MAEKTSYILIYTHQPTPRLSYVFQVFFEHIVHCSYRITSNEEEFSAYEGPRIRYSKTPDKKADIIHIPEAGLLHHNIGLNDFVAKTEWEGIPALFPVENSAKDYPFDLLSTCFYLLSFFEMYHPGKSRDDLFRFPASSSIAYQYGFLERPIVDEWCLHLVKKIQQLWPAFDIQRPAYQFTPTYDIDLTWAYGHRPFLRQIGSIARDFAKADLKNLVRRLQVQLGKKQDPFFTFPFLEELHQTHDLPAKYFFLLGDYGGFDTNIHHEDPEQKQLFKNLAEKYNCGLHPSIKSNLVSGQLQEELLRFQNITGATAGRSRQHYLLFDLPRTFRRLHQHGIREDYSVGYADHPGFRAGIARPFPWYDLLQEAATDLLLHPFVIMDQALRRSSGKDHASQKEKFLYFAQTIRSVNGHFYTLWHNSSFSPIEGWEGGIQLYKELILEALPK